MKKISAEVTGISASGPQQGYVVILREKDGSRLLPIFIGVAEAHNIHLLLNGFKYIRPLTFDLFQNLLNVSDTRIEEVTVTDLKDNTYYAEITLSVDGVPQKPIDARPSDAIALALKTKAKINISDDVLDKAGFVGANERETHIVSEIQNLENLEDEIVLQERNMKDAEINEEYEKAAVIRDKIKALKQKQEKIFSSER